MRLLDLRWRAFASYLSRSTNPILCGPFRSEVGFETLYWIPFLTAFRERYKIPKERLFYIGRGGSASWFDAAGRADLYEFLPLEAVRTLSTQTGHQTGSIKQLRPEGWERDVCNLAARATGLSTFHILSPTWMYQILSPFWEGKETLHWLDQHTLHPARLPAPSLPAGLKLPEQYVAMRWYARATFPLKEDLVLWARRFTEAVASRIPVILINSGMQTDDHSDINLGPIENTVKLSDLCKLDPVNNLAIQSSVIARAQAYAGTYGGMAQGAMRWGIPTIALYDQFGQTAPAHLHLTQSLSLKSGIPFVATQPRHFDALLPLILVKREAAA